MNLSSLPDNVDELKQIIVTLSGQTDQLREEVLLLRKLRFAQKSEKWTKDDELQATLFDEAEAQTAPEPKQKAVVVKTHSRKRRGRKAIDPSLPRTEIVHDLSSHEKTCECGAELSQIGEDTREELDFTPAKFRVNRHVYPKYACRHCEGLADESKPAVRSATKESAVIPGSFASPGLLAWLFTDKFENHLPFYRQERILRRLGVDLPRATMCNWAVHIGRRLGRFLALMRRDLLSGPLIAADETPLQVLNEPGRPNTSKSYMWLFKGGPPQRPVLLYRYAPTRSGTVPDRFIRRDFRGTLLTDGYSGYNVVHTRPHITPAGCWAHVRRKFKEAADAAKAGGSGNTFSSAGEMLGSIQKLYAVEIEVSEAGLTEGAVAAYRQEHSKPVVEDIETTLHRLKAQVVPESLLGKAVDYALGQWHKLTPFLSDENIPLDNNAVENAVRPFVLGRKNWLFSGSPRGAHASTALYSMIETAKANGLDPYWYLRFLFSRLRTTRKRDEIRLLMPNRIDKDVLEAFRKNEESPP